MGAEVMQTCGMELEFLGLSGHLAFYKSVRRHLLIIDI